MKNFISTLLLLSMFIFLSSCDGNKTSNAETIEEQVAEEAKNALDEISEVVGDESGPILSESDIEKFKETFLPMAKEFEELGKGIEDDDNMDLSALFASAEVKSVLDKYGWDEDFGKKYMTIFMGFGYISMEEQVNELPEAQREQYRQLMSAQLEQYKGMVNEDDIELLKKHSTELKELFEKANSSN
ncbi:MAG: hypothetical protein OEW75_09740 [Cyclobacteriaceae bacterium]|nr:hypothetical protein [Cyclobacteriaceae bacterium]